MIFLDPILGYIRGVQPQLVASPSAFATEYRGGVLHIGVSLRVCGGVGRGTLEAHWVMEA